MRRQTAREQRAVLAIALLAATPCLAQTTSRVSGRVVDATGGVLLGATVTISGPMLQGVRTTTADRDGRYRFLALPPGTHTLTASLPGFGTVQRSDVRVPLDGTVTLDISLRPADVSETVNVGDSVTAIGVTSTTTGATFDSQLIEQLPMARNYQALALAAPGVSAGGLGINNPSVAGASAAENRYLVDGQDTTDPAFGTSRFSLPMEFIAELEVKTGGYQAEYGGALGGILNVVTKSGSNAFKGGIFAYYSGDSLRSTPPPTQTVGKDLGILDMHDIGADVGGKLIKDKLWYFGAFNLIFADQGWEGYTGNRHVELRRNRLFSGKLTWQAAPGHSVVGSLSGDSVRAEKARGRGFTGGAPTAGFILGDDKTTTYNYGLAYNGIIGSRGLLKVTAARFDQNERSVPAADEPIYVDNTPDARFVRRFAVGDCGDLSAPRVGIRFTPSCLGGAFVQEAGDRSRDELRSAFSWFMATGRIAHEWKLGATYRNVRYRDTSHYPAPVPGPLVDQAGTSVSGNGVAGQRYALRADSYRLMDYDQDSRARTTELALFLQDQLRLHDRVTLSLGLRFDSSRSTGELTAASNGERELRFGLGDTIAPRIGLVFDPIGDARSKVFGHYGRFYESIPLDLSIHAFGTESSRSFDFRYPSDGSLPNGHNQGVLYETFVLGTGTGTKVQDNLKAMYSEEYVAGFEYQVGKQVAVGLKGVYRSLGEVIEDISVDGGHTFFIANLGRARTHTSNPVTGEPLPEPITFPAAERRYKALELTVTKTLGKGWRGHASYVLSHTAGNYGGLFRQDTGQLNPNISSLFDLPTLLKGADGLLPNDRRHQFKTYGTCRLPFAGTLGVFAEYLTGTPISKLGANNKYGRRERFIGNRGRFGQTPATWHVDIHVEYPLKLSHRFGVRLIADVFNVTNQAAAVRVDQEWTLNALESTVEVDECGGSQPDCAGANRTYGLATAFQDPRTVRLGVKMGW